MKILFGKLFGLQTYDLNRDFLRQLRRSFWTVTRHILLLLIVLVLYLFILFKNPQGIDIVGEVILNKRYWVWTLLALLALGTSLWFCATFLLQMKKISHDVAFKEDNGQGIQFWLDYLPGVLGLLPMIALLFKGDLYRGESWGFLGILFLLILLLPVLVKSLVKRFESTLSSVKWFDGISMEDRSLKSLLYFRGTRTIFWTFVGYSFVLFVLSLTSVQTGVAVLIGPFAVMIFGLSFTCAVLSLVMYYNVPGRRPALLFFGVYVAVISSWNDNSSIRTLPMKTTRVTLEQDFQQWARKLVDNRFAHDKDTSNASDTLHVPIIFVATEGGGIRALFWTALVLQKLEAKFPGLHNNIYGISGVSGGGVGATFYISYLHDQLKQRRHLDPDDPSFIDAVHSDFLSDLLASFLFQDNLQNVLPIAIRSFDRSRQLEDAWSHSFSFHTNSDTFEKGFTNLYSNTALRVPRLFINGTLAESGQKTIVSYPLLRLHPDSAQNKPYVLQDEIDVLESIGTDIPVKTAASLCSRFPYLTSGGFIEKPGGQGIGHVVDGGYRENTGLETVWQLLLRLRPIMQREQRQDSTSGRKKKVQFQPVVLFIKNSPPTAVLDSARNIAGRLHEQLIPLLGSSNASDRRTSSIDVLTANVFKNYVPEAAGMKPCVYEVFDLDRTRAGGYTLPLGWYFSDNSFRFVQKQADLTLGKKDSLYTRLTQHINPLNLWKD